MANAVEFSITQPVPCSKLREKVGTSNLARQRFPRARQTITRFYSRTGPLLHSLALIREDERRKCRSAAVGFNLESRPNGFERSLLNRDFRKAELQARAQFPHLLKDVALPPAVCNFHLALNCTNLQCWSGDSLHIRSQDYLPAL
jgi:hypothetical protein